VIKFCKGNAHFSHRLVIHFTFSCPVCWEKYQNEKLQAALTQAEAQKQPVSIVNTVSELANTAESVIHTIATARELF